MGFGFLGKMIIFGHLSLMEGTILPWEVLLLREINPENDAVFPLLGVSLTTKKWIGERDDGMIETKMAV